MNKRGFTLIELLGVIILITLVSFLVFPTVLNKIKESKKTIDSATEKLLINSAKLYIADNQNSYSDDYAYESCIKIDDLVKENYIDEDLIKEYSTTLDGKVIKVSYNSVFEYSIISSEKCTYEENIIAGNEPELNGLTPVVYDGSSWVVADTSTPWYSYSEKKWANAVLLHDSVEKETGDSINLISDVIAMYVWVPRYRYAIPTGTSAQEINIIFEKTTEKKSTGTGSASSFLTHPAFTFGNKELSGIWVGKFETSGGATPVVLPNQTSATSANATISAQYNLAKTYNNYGLTDIDAHMMKNSEWGAVAYLAQSKYGINSEVRINNTSPVVTGCSATMHDGAVSTTCQNEYNTEIGYLASTTGNISGIYDMNGGNKEAVMLNYQKTVGASGFTTSFFTDNSKYYNLITTYQADTCAMGLCNGSAISETLGWYNDSSIIDANTIITASPFMTRGGLSSVSATSGLFAFESYTGGANSAITYRSVIVPVGD